MQVPLHPGTHLNDMGALKRLRDIWVNANHHKRQVIISDILMEIENFGDCYNSDIEVVFDDDVEEKD